MKILILILIFFQFLCYSEEKNVFESYRKILFDHAEILSEYPVGAVFLKKDPSDTLFVTGSEGGVGWSSPCSGKTETKSTILEAGFDEKPYYGVYHYDTRYYVLEEITLWLNKERSNYEFCKNHFGTEVPIIKKIFLKEKERISLVDLKKLFKQDILEFDILDKDRAKILRLPEIILPMYPYCGPHFPPRPPGIPAKNGKDLIDEKTEVIMDFSRPWAYAEERVIYKFKNRDELMYTITRLPNVEPDDLYEQIKDIEVDLGTYSYPLTQRCKKVFYFPKLKWSEIKNWRPPWPGKI